VLHLHILKEISGVVCSLPAIFSVMPLGVGTESSMNIFCPLFCEGEDKNNVIKMSVSFLSYFATQSLPESRVLINSSHT
jgi:hypothetical protein